MSSQSRRVSQSSRQLDLSLLNTIPITDDNTDQVLHIGLQKLDNATVLTYGKSENITARNSRFQVYDFSQQLEQNIQCIKQCLHTLIKESHSLHNTRLNNLINDDAPDLLLDALDDVYAILLAQCTKEEAEPVVQNAIDMNVYRNLKENQVELQKILSTIEQMQATLRAEEETLASVTESLNAQTANIAQPSSTKAGPSRRNTRSSHKPCETQQSVNVTSQQQPMPSTSTASPVQAPEEPKGKRGRGGGGRGRAKRMKTIIEDSPKIPKTPPRTRRRAAQDAQVSTTTPQLN